MSKRRDDSFKLQVEVDATPVGTDWSQFVSTPLPPVSRCLRVGFPCCGMDSGEVFYYMKCPFEAHNIYDLEAGYETALKTMFLKHAGHTPVLHLGKVRGDITKVHFRAIVPIDILVAGPPCPPFSTCGLRHGIRDARFKPFQAVVEWIAGDRPRWKLVRRMFLEEVMHSHWKLFTVP